MLVAGVRPAASAQDGDHAEGRPRAATPAEHAGHYRLGSVAGDDVVLDAVAGALVAGRIVAVKGLGGFQLFGPGERRLLDRMLETGTHAPVTTSMGRLFDAVASLVGLPAHVSFEGEAAMALEFVADETETASYVFLLADADDGSIVVDWADALRAAVEDCRRGSAAAKVAARFHNGLVATAVAIAERIGEGRIVLSGGCFQNRLLTGRLADALGAAGFEVLLHRHVRPNDGGISLGQVAVAAAALGSG